MGLIRGKRYCFLAPVKDRMADILIPIIKQWIKPGTKVIFNCWIRQGGYIHGMVNNSIEFDNSGGHTQSIESTWRVITTQVRLQGNHSTTPTCQNSYSKGSTFKMG